MPCNEYQDALMDLASTGHATAALGQHLPLCGACRERLEQERILLTAIDAGVSLAANRPVPGSLVPRVLEEIHTTSGPRRISWRYAWLAIPTGLAAAALLLLLRPVAPPDARKGPQTSPTVRASVWTEPGSVVPKAGRPGRKSVTVSRRASGRPAATGVNSSDFPEVLVPDEEGQAFRRFVARLRSDEGLAQAYLTPAPRRPAGAPEMAVVEIARLHVPPLDGTVE